MNAMNTMTYNTLDAVRRLQAIGVERATAEAYVDEIIAAQKDLFTKQDGEMLAAKLKAEIIMWLTGMMIAVNGFTATILFFALRH